ncbi:hypothetical protein DIC66_01515 [Rhodoferax lacus]|uniref:DUF2497 domain-containing protein n=1 Tax=Rhodoferax lacus TaxID=2184758 RepID=A0A3E1RHW2_9BURK|nr:hypothetical protein [Rhodoferax lacus]RFO98592.1 hypothetical protein DIC66_01515 [Rhodoferax lacus]
MSSRPPPRYLPTLTEVVDPRTVSLAASAPISDPAMAQPVVAPVTEPFAEPFAEPVPEPAFAVAPPPHATPASQEPTHNATPSYSAAPVSAAPDKQALAQQLIKLVKPQLEAELRNIAQELFEAQFSALLPSMHLHIEEAVREAIEQALPEPPDAVN